MERGKSMGEDKLLLAIHEQAEKIQEAIGANYEGRDEEILKEAVYLLSFLITYVSKHHENLNVPYTS